MCVSVDDQQRAVLACQFAQGSMKPFVREHHACVCQRRFRQNAGNVFHCQFPFQSRYVVKLDDACGHVERNRRSDAALARVDLSVVEPGQRFVVSAVVAAVEHEDLSPARDCARDPCCKAIRIRGGQRERPARQPGAALELGRDRHAVLGWQHVGEAAIDGVAHRGNEHARGMPEHCPGIAEAEIDVLVTVNVGNLRAFCAFDKHRERAFPFDEPWHLHAGQEVRRRLQCQLPRSRMRRFEVLFLPVEQISDASPADCLRKVFP